MVEVRGLHSAAQLTVGWTIHAPRRESRSSSRLHFCLPPLKAPCKTKVVFIVLAFLKVRKTHLQSLSFLEIINMSDQCVSHG